MKQIKNVVKLQATIAVIGVLTIARPALGELPGVVDESHAVEVSAELVRDAIVTPVVNGSPQESESVRPQESETSEPTIDLSGVDWTALARHVYGKCGEWRDLAIGIGWPVEQWPTLSYVLHRESRCNIDSFNPTDPNGGSRGLMQINGFWCRPNRYTSQGWLQDKGILSHCDDLYNPETNLRAGLAMWNYSEDHNGCGWRPWATRCQ